ncbi:MAG: cell wall hydrolase [Rhodovarius sp.]|nr:cell wall hydrolase [Rhodovarius sp.]
MSPAEILARTLHAEAGGCPARGIEALAALILNRARAALACPTARARFSAGRTAPDLVGMVALVCLAPFQFPALRRTPRPAEDDPVLAMCRRIAARALAGSLPDLAQGATHFHRLSELPAWAIGRQPVAEKGGLALYRLAA